MPTEIELKYQLSANSKENKVIIDDITTLLKARQLAFKMKHNQLANDYFDTANLALRKMDFGLRIRTKNNQYEQTIKTAGKVVGCLHQRPEFNIAMATKQLDLSLFPTSIWPHNTDIEALQQNLQVIFSTNFSRQTWLIEQDDSVIELALDIGEISTVSGAATVAIHEVEIELVSGNEQALFVLAEQLMTVVAMTPSKLSKAARGYALYHDHKDCV